MANGFELSFGFVEKWGRFAKADYLQIYIYILSQFKKTGKTMKPITVAKKLDKEQDTVEAALEFWETAGMLVLTEDGYSFVDEVDKTAAKKERTKKKETAADRFRSRPSYMPAEIDAAATVNKDVDYLFRQAEKILGRLLSQSDYEMLYSFVDWLGLPVEVVSMLLTYASGMGKTGKRYLETVAIDWTDKGIDTYEKAEAYIKELELKTSNEGKIRSVLGIYDRALSQTEKKYISMWTFGKNISPDLVSEAYDRTVKATGKLSWAYMNKILLSWCDEGVLTVDEIKEKEALFKLKAAPTKVKISGRKKRPGDYEDTNKQDYTDYAEQILNDMLEG